MQLVAHPGYSVVSATSCSCQAWFPIPAQSWSSPRWSTEMDSWRVSPDIFGRGRALQPVHLPPIFEDDNGTSASGNPSLMYDVTGQIEIPVLAHVKAFACVAVLEKM